MDRELSIVDGLLTVLFAPFYLVWLILSFILKLLGDVARNVYGRAVVALGAIAFAVLALLFSNLLK